MLRNDSLDRPARLSAAVVPPAPHRESRISLRALLPIRSGWIEIAPGQAPVTGKGKCPRWEQSGNVRDVVAFLQVFGLGHRVEKSVFGDVIVCRRARGTAEERERGLVFDLRRPSRQTDVASLRAPGAETKWKVARFDHLGGSSTRLS